ncbi:Fic/DOC family protein [Terriglobus sp.]|uniref:Fic/DOC family protein n=1 Tax=Terriglobus sp. TaxID=1889013 RepID=UPI003B00A1AC
MVGARSPEDLKQREEAFTSLRIAELKRDPVPGRLDFDHLKEMHRRVYQDVYEWAGKVREGFDAAKQDYVGGTAHAFTPSAQIKAEGRRIFRELADKDHLRGLSRPEFVGQLARLHGEVNQLHPFPEGNGRTQRLFLEEIAHVPVTR